jgi:hypothetical protein
MNTSRFLENPKSYFEGSYQEFDSFGGPCVYFHEQCLLGGSDAFLSDRHIEMLYATLTAWGMHRMGDGKTKLVRWSEFSASLLKHKETLESLRALRMMDITDAEYLRVIDRLRTPYIDMRISISDASIVGNSKALFHLLPELIPPIDRQYTWRFFHSPPERWKDAKGKFRAIQLPAGLEPQFDAFREVCLRIKHLAYATGRATIEAERRIHGVTPPKAVDNAIVKFIKVHSKTQSTD